jgi:hypothetical protein
MPWTPKASYLGDGAYVTQDPGGHPEMIWLYADRDGMRHEVALDRTAFAELQRFVADVWSRDV